jgi:hypothetical protein
MHADYFGWQQNSVPASELGANAELNARFVSGDKQEWSADSCSDPASRPEHKATAIHTQ